MSDDVPFNEVPAEQTTSMVSVQTDATHRTASPMVPPKVKLDHLGKPLKEGKQRYRYARTCTIVYDGAGSAESAAKEKTWRLLQDARRALDLSGAGLDALFRILQRQAPARNHSLMEAPAFRQAFHQYFKSHGVRDMILVRRLFADFKEPVIEHEEPIIDFRQFVRVLAGMSHEHVEHRLEVLFDVWDADESGTLSFPELASHVTHDLPIHRVAGAMEEFTMVWGQIKRFAANARREAGEDVDDDDPFAAGGGLGKKKVDANAAEIEKKHLVAACVVRARGASPGHGRLPKRQNLPRAHLHMGVA
jgi:Ca2+-binding EF-hand superfamily protein